MKIPTIITLFVLLCTLLLFSCDSKTEKQKEQNLQEDAFQKKVDSLNEKKNQKNSKKRSKAQELDTLKMKRL